MTFQDMRQMPIFTDFSDEQLHDLRVQGMEVRLDGGQVLFEEGDDAHGLYVILEGELEIIKRIGGQVLVVAHVPSGSFVGEISLLTGMPHNATARTTMPSRFLKYEVHLFDSIKALPMAQLMLGTMVARLRDTESQIQQQEKLSALGKMAAGLAHELNNPASANLRAATQLSPTLATLQTQTLRLYNAHFNADQLAFLSELQSQLIGRTAKNVALNPLEQSDLEDQIILWCDDAGVLESWKIAPALASAGVNAEELVRIREVIGVEALTDTLNWLESSLSIAGLSYTIKQSAARISDLIKAVKAYTYMDQSPTQEIDVHDGLESTLMVLQNRLEGIEIARTYNRNLPRITAYGSELNQVWTILLDNAADAVTEKATHGVGRICLRTSQENEFILVEVIDDGTGIPPELQSRLFEPFFTTKPIGQGTGLSLSVARRIVVERHRGMIHVISHPGETCFQVFLPTR